MPLSNELQEVLARSRRRQPFRELVTDCPDVADVSLARDDRPLVADPDDVIDPTIQARGYRSL